jgi:hypothetical protein
VLIGEFLFTLDSGQKLTQNGRIRVWQDPDCKDCAVTCDPPGYPTTAYIEKHKKAYENANLTQWDQTGYDWPLNDYVNTCKT